MRTIQTTLQHSEKKLRTLFELSPLGIALTDMKGRYLEFNKAFESICGYSADELHQIDYWTLTPEKYFEEEKQRLVELRATGRYGPYEKEYVQKSGRLVPLRLNGVLVEGSDGDPLIWSIVEDVTKPKVVEAQLREGESRFRLLASATFEGIIVSEGGQVIDCNAQALDLLGYGREELIGRAILEMIVDEDRGKVEANIRAHRESTVENRMLKKNGERILVEAHGQTLAIDGRNVRITALRDITERKKIEAELFEHRYRLERIVEERTRELQAAKEVSEAASRAKSTFLTNMSHELRTPFHGILGAITLARARMLDPRGKDLLDKAKTATNHLLQVINDILDISKIEAERMVLESVEFKLLPIFENVLSLLEQRAKAKGLHIDTEIAPDLINRILVGDPMRLTQVLINLVGNAVKFTEVGSVRLAVRQHESHDSEISLRFEVIDTGIGISEIDLTRLFTAFEQADASMTRKYGGTGLGLAICKRLVGLMGGRMGVTSFSGQGSTFWFELKLPAATPSEDPHRRPGDPISGSERLRAVYASKRILLAEDDPVNREVALGMLEDLGTAVEVATDGQEALRLAKMNRYDLILMDMQMPIMNGIEATLAIRADSVNAQTPILAMTANAFVEDRQRCLEAGMNEHVAKPVIPEALYDAIDRWIGK